MSIIEEISAEKAAKLIAEKPALEILDIRTEMEFDAGRIKHAQLIDVYEPDFIERIKNLPREKEYLLYCRSGVRTANALPIFEKLGFQKIYHLTYGILDWQQERLPLEK
ncbi:MAG: rhodanese-like domain-containing protein [Candidatus Gracilibacteria bacterium]|jgi:rhodanese-related sulfurtransferase|nr:rhodanese-like domain-containing protein [Candidatus Gracilibacteria bacterium]MDD5178873.1 rhodanese-like domain-containing protein [Candidatus Gracilibacteria bacterium]